MRVPLLCCAAAAYVLREAQDRSLPQLVSKVNFLVVRPHEWWISIGQERDRFITPRLLTNRIASLNEDEPPKIQSTHQTSVNECF